MSVFIINNAYAIFPRLFRVTAFLVSGGAETPSFLLCYPCRFLAFLATCKGLGLYGRWASVGFFNHLLLPSSLWTYKGIKFLVPRTLLALYAFITKVLYPTASFTIIWLISPLLWLICASFYNLLLRFW